MPKLQLKLVLPCLVALVVSGCQLWHPGGATYAEKDGKFNVKIPDGWQYATSVGPDLLASKDGPILQQVDIEHRDLEKALPNSKRPLPPNLDAFQLAETIAGDLKADHKLAAFELKQNEPAVIGGKNGCRLIYTFQTEQKLRLSEELYACVVDKQLWVLRFRAPTRHYFDRDLAQFDELVRSFRFGKS